MHIILFVLFVIICFDVFIISSVYRFIWFIHPSGLLHCNMITLVPVDVFTILLWRHNERIRVSNHQPHDCLLNRLFRHRSKKTSKLCVTGLCTGNSSVTGEFPARRASNAEKYFHLMTSSWYGQNLPAAIHNKAKQRVNHMYDSRDELFVISKLWEHYPSVNLWKSGWSGVSVLSSCVNLHKSSINFWLKSEIWLSTESALHSRCYHDANFFLLAHVIVVKFTELAPWWLSFQSWSNAEKKYIIDHINPHICYHN